MEYSAIILAAGLMAEPAFASLEPSPAAALMRHDAPYAFIEPAARSAVRRVHPARILRIDDAAVGPRGGSPVAPGLHSVEISVPPPMGVGLATRQTLVFYARSCMRYTIATSQASPTSRKWSAYVEAVEPIGECTHRFGA